MQIFGADPETMTEAAHLNSIEWGPLININMGCPAKKIYKVATGSALLKDPLQAAKILDAVIKAADMPVTLKIRTGWNPENRNGVARIAEYDIIREIKYRKW
ncbi:tRNA-dihydrouridine synthase [Candidatus Vondammii sp. HM_W22]|uniref:tRNA-dihydrouridine synthase n=1 Tax=Candidatus Vondammii sp. HM_W22 TaxID=2687299 RepID=UPI001F13C45B|nr:tRNA-dihydrouridine synthase [Candidatus Vondammii sp. HM_W22]